MKRKSLVFVILAVTAIIGFAGVYDTLLNGTLGKILIRNDPGYNDYSGIVREVIPVTTVSAGDLVYVSTSTGAAYPYVRKADSDAANTTGDILVMIAAATSYGIVPALEYGTMRCSTWNFAGPGLPVYVSNTAGLATTTAQASTKYGQIIGYTISGNVIRFKPEAKATVVP